MLTTQILISIQGLFKSLKYIKMHTHIHILPVTSTALHACNWCRATVNLARLPCAHLWKMKEIMWSMLVMSIQHYGMNNSFQTHSWNSFLIHLSHSCIPSISHTLLSINYIHSLLLVFTYCYLYIRICLCCNLGSLYM